jgi:hypothetical protein
MFFHDKRRWIEAVKEFEERHNSSYHTSIKMAPNSVNAYNEMNVWMDLYGDYDKMDRHSKFSTGDVVMIARKRGIFEKAHTNPWSLHEYEIVKVNESHIPSMYSLVVLPDREIVRGQFNEHELLPIRYYVNRTDNNEEGNLFEVTPTPPVINKVVKYLTSPKRMYLVNYKNTPQSKTVWLDESDIDPETRKIMRGRYK